ncbi:MAG: type III secretion system export apparatus subunit SctU [Simkaniaceae bacterium]|nr:type III secretion system export apparatus subunit SctU [Simkaniaceae bacterium]
MGEKTEKATPKKLRDARKKGQIAKSKDFPAAFTFVVSIATVILSAGTIYNNLASYLINMFRQIPHSNELTSRAPAYMRQAIDLIFQTSIPVLIFTVLVGVLVSFLVQGPVFSMQAMKPDVKKFNPVTNIKNLFKLKTFIELLKSIAKITVALILIMTVMWGSLGEIISLVKAPVHASMLVFASFLIKVVIRVGIFFLIVAVFDLVFQKKNFAKEMKMEKFEVKQEYKDTEGNPEIKGKRRQRAQEIAYQDGPGAAKRARAVVTNPVHIAVALEYNEEEDPTPKICVMGKGEIAKKIVQIALDNNIPIMRNITLAELLYEMGNIGDYIPEEAYDAVAKILKWLQEIESEAEYNLGLFGGAQTPPPPEE